MKFNRKEWRTLIGAVAAVALLAGLGWWTGERSAKYADAEMRERLLRQAVDIARILNPEMAKKLTFTPADKGTPAFDHIREQMTIYCRTFPHRGIYSMVLCEGKIFFGPENYPENEPMANPPGMEYKKPPAE